MTAALLRRAAAPARAAAEPPALPAWPLLLLLHGVPVFWVLGLSPFSLPLLAAVMAVLLATRGPVRLVPGVLPFLAFLAWVMASSVMLEGAGQAMGYALRLADLVSLGVVLLYYANARETLDVDRVLRGFLTIWVTLVVLGVAAILAPEIRLATPVGAVLPGALVSNELVNDLVNPPLAEVQQPWGAEEPYNRPAAPFPYANSWGMAFVLLTPVAGLAAWRARSGWLRVLLLAGIALSFWPAAETSNRGMFLGLGCYTCYLCARWLLRGRLGPPAVLTSIVLAVATALVATGVVAEILGRQEVSNTTEGRASIYLTTLREALESPLLGWATPRMDPTIGISLGTQGYIWTLVFCYGFVGCGLFLLFLGGAAVRTAAMDGDRALMLHALLVTPLLTIWFYGLGSTQLLIVTLCAAVLLTARHDGERL